MSNNCSYENCLTCPISSCWTGEIARTQGIEAYNKHLEMLDQAEEVVDTEIQ